MRLPRWWCVLARGALGLGLLLTACSGGSSPGDAVPDSPSASPPAMTQQPQSSATTDTPDTADAPPDTPDAAPAPDRPDAAAAPREPALPRLVADVASIEGSEARLTPEAVAAGDEFGWAGAISGSTMVISAPLHDARGEDTGTAFVYELVDGAWVERTQLAPRGPLNPSAWFGRWVDVEGDVIAVSAPYLDVFGDGRGGGRVYVFEPHGVGWVETAQLAASDAARGAAFGYGLALSGDVLVVGAPGDPQEHVDPTLTGGSAYVFRRTAAGWVQEARLRPSRSAAGDRFGYAVSVDGDAVVVGAPSLSVDGAEAAGAAFVFEQTGGRWSEVAMLQRATPAPHDELGSAVDVEGGTVMAGAYRADAVGQDSGAVFVFTRPEDGWGATSLESAELVAIDTRAGDGFGYALDQRGDLLLVGAPLRDHPSAPAAGTAYLFERQDGAWLPVAQVFNDDAATAGADANFGWTVWLDGPAAGGGSVGAGSEGASYAGVGAWLADNAAGADAGAAYVYSLSGETPAAIVERPPLTGLEARPAFGGRTFFSPVEMVFGPDGRAWVADLDGLVQSISEDGEDVRTVLNLRPALERRGSEQGLLSIQFDPQFDSNARLWTYYSVAGRDRTRLSYFLVGRDGTVDANSEVVVFEVEEPFDNHNGGAIRFGPDGLLYLGLGDGGAGGDPFENGQDPTTLLGTIVRLDVRASTAEAPYAIPPGNPFADNPTAGRPEVFAYGLRNPWRMEFDSRTGLLWVADVGQSAWEEITVVRAGENHGWSRLEGRSCYPPSAGCTPAGTVLPVAVYGHDQGCSVIGGPVYRASRHPALQGRYVYSDLCSGRLWVLDADAPGEPREVGNLGAAPSSFAVGPDGRLYVLTFSGPILELTPAP